METSESGARGVRRKLDCFSSVVRRKMCPGTQRASACSTARERWQSGNIREVGGLVMGWLGMTVVLWKSKGVAIEEFCNEF